ncbi:propionyl-CoA carboxylase alpha chain [Mumia flava]|uniref:Propionyl-CoA carboxylase alpha chain n=1 Tax=Mumia flava TaxID=1348852 RepID=A0A0B2B728_9ACTN|nr:biotin carboxylase N-terminal domain-containing protein [Mumia flava]PJJ57911.1 propionyl-CoA carboxylase alpha chain [Mumia flava]
MIGTVLVANRGEIARRVFATCRALGIATVAVHSDADADAPFVRDADTSVRLPGAAPADTYLRADLVIAAARTAGADAIHPGYGFLSENASFAAAVRDAGLTWIGPSPDAIEAMGSKVRAKELMAAAGGPVGGMLDPADVTADDLPVVVKASSGGGGRGMRVVRDLADLPGALEQAGSEAASAFGDATVFVEHYLEHARHVEVQVVADEHGTCWVVGDRDCSLQRRHQKVVEEAPAPGLSDATRTALHDAARGIVKQVGYTGAGTVEFLVDQRHSEERQSEKGGDAGARISFLEMNTRLQVEHPVTEAVTGLDLVALQIAVAEGRTLADAAGVAEPPAPRGHAIEVRLYAEDPADDFAPQTGTVRAFEVPGVRARFGSLDAYGLRLDSGVEAGTDVGIHYDAMLAKVVAWAPDRNAAIRMLRGALRRSRLHGVTTNLDLLDGILGAPAFADPVSLSTLLLGDRLDDWAAPRIASESRVAYATAAALARAAAVAAQAPVLARIPAGYRNVASQPHTVTFGVDDDELTVAYVSERGRLRPADGGLVAETVAPDRVVLVRDGVATAYGVVRSGATAGAETVDVDGPAGSLSLQVVPRFVDPADQVAAGSLLAPMPAAVVSVAVEAGQRIAAGEVVVVLEAMKMQHTITAPTDGVVSELAATAGSQVESGAVLAVITEPDTEPDTEPATDQPDADEGDDA